MDEDETNFDGVVVEPLMELGSFLLYFQEKDGGSNPSIQSGLSAGHH